MATRVTDGARRDEVEQNIVICQWRADQVLFAEAEGKWSNLPFFTQERSHVVSFTHEQAIICSQLFAGHVAGFMANEKEEKFAWNDNEFYLWKWNDISNVLVETVQPAEQFFFIFHLIDE